MKKKRILIPSINPVDNYTHALSMLGAESFVSDHIPDITDFDGLLLPGGTDIDPKRYQEENTDSIGIDPVLDQLQFSVLDQFTEAKKPVLGICRGHQLINVFFEGSLYQNIEQAEQHRYNGDDQTHMTNAEKDSFIAKLYGESFAVNSAHHQAVKRIGKDLIACQWSEDSVIEAMYHTSLPVYSVQWHPERMCFQKKREDTVDGSILLQWFLSLIPDSE